MAIQDSTRNPLIYADSPGDTAVSIANVLAFLQAVTYETEAPLTHNQADGRRLILECVEQAARSMDSQTKGASHD